MAHETLLITTSMITEPQHKETPALSPAFQIQYGRAAKGRCKCPNAAALNGLPRHRRVPCDVEPLHRKSPRSVGQLDRELSLVSRLENEVFLAPLGQTVSRLR